MICPSIITYFYHLCHNFCIKVQEKEINILLDKSVNFYYYSHCQLWSVGQAVKTPPSHGGNRGSIPLRTIEDDRRYLPPVFLFFRELWNISYGNLKIMNSGQNDIFHVLFLKRKMVKYESGNTCVKELSTQKEVYRWVFLKR